MYIYAHVHCAYVATGMQWQPWFGRLKVDEVSSLVALEVILLVDLHSEVEVSFTPLFAT